MLGPADELTSLRQSVESPSVLTGMVRQDYDVDLRSFGPHLWEATALTGNPIGGAPLIAGHAAAETPWRGAACG